LVAGGSALSNFAPMRATLCATLSDERAVSGIFRDLFESYRGRLVWVAEFLPNLWLTHDAESESSRRLSFSPHLATTCVVSPRRESLNPSGASAASGH